MLDFKPLEDNPLATEFCRSFVNASSENRGILGRNEYAEGIAGQVEVGFFIDDFTEVTEYLGKPVIKTDQVPRHALVVSTLLGKPLTGERHLSGAAIRHLDYFAFHKHSGFDLPPVRFWGDFKKEYKDNQEKYRWVESRLSDADSLLTFRKIINFRLSGNLSYMEGFSDRQKEQYFENFLELKTTGEVFVDIGGYDGYTSLEFIRRCPDYDAVYFFEPNAVNMALAKENLCGHDNVCFFQMGLSNQAETLYFSSEGSVFSQSKDGNVAVNVDTLDRLVDGKVTFIKMDIEGAEGKALEGARDKIKADHPILAICVYHRHADLRIIPEQVLSMRDDYRVYLRHYTEGVVETVMFFVPK